MIREKEKELDGLILELIDNLSVSLRDIDKSMGLGFGNVYQWKVRGSIYAGRQKIVMKFLHNHIKKINKIYDKINKKIQPFIK